MKEHYKNFHGWGNLNDLARIIPSISEYNKLVERHILSNLDKIADEIVEKIRETQSKRIEMYIASVEGYKRNEELEKRLQEKIMERLTRVD